MWFAAEVSSLHPPPTSLEAPISLIVLWEECSATVVLKCLFNSMLCCPFSSLSRGGEVTLMPWWPLTTVLRRLMHQHFHKSPSCHLWGMALSHGGVIQDKLLCVAAVSWNHPISSFHQRHSDPRIELPWKCTLRTFTPQGKRDCLVSYKACLLFSRLCHMH